MSDCSVLFLEERQLLGEQDGPYVRIVQTGYGAFRIAGLEGVLRGKQSVTGRTGGEDLADVIEVLAPGITGAHGQLLEQVIGAELQLHTMVVREAAVVAGASDTKSTIHT